MKNLILLITIITCLNGFSQEYKVIGNINDLKLINLNGKLGVIDNNENFVVTPDDYKKISFDEDNWVYRCYKGKKTFEIVSESNKKVKSKWLFTDILENDGNGLLKVKSEDGVGYIKNGEEYISPIYDKISIEIETYLSCCHNYVLEKDGKKGLFVNNQFILKVEYDDFEAENSYEELPLIIVTKDLKKGLIYPFYWDDSAKKELPSFELLAPVFKSITSVKTEQGTPLFLVNNGLVSGLYDALKNQYVIPLEFSELDWKNRKTLEYVYVIEVKQNDEINFLVTDLKNDSLSILTEEIIYFDNEEMAAIKNKAGKFQLIKMSYGIQVDTNSYQEIKELSHEHFAVKLNNKWGMIDEYFSEIIECSFNSLEELKSNYREEY